MDQSMGSLHQPLVEETNSSTADASARRVLFIGALLVTTLVSGGLIEGFGPLTVMLGKERGGLGQFSETCAAGRLATDPPCDGQSTHMQTFLFAGLQSLSAASVLFGLVLDAVGPRYTAAGGLILSVAGNLLFAYADSETFNVFVPAYCLIAAGGIAPFLAAFSFAGLFGRATTLFVSLMPAGLALSGMIYMLPESLGWSRRNFFTGYAIMSGAMSLVCLALYPTSAPDSSKPFRPPVLALFCSGSDSGAEEEKKETDNHNADDNDVEVAKGRDEIQEDHFETVGDVAGRQQWWRQASVWRHAYAYAIGLLAFSFAAGELPLRVLTDIGSSASNLCSPPTFTTYVVPLVGNSVFLTAPLCAIVIERFGFRTAGVVTNVLGQLVLAGLLFNTQSGMLGVTVAMNFFHGFLFTVFFDLIHDTFPIEVIGRCVALCTAVASVVGFGSYPLNDMRAAHGVTLPIAMLLGATTLAYPCVLYYTGGGGAGSHGASAGRTGPHPALLRPENRGGAVGQFRTFGGWAVSSGSRRLASFNSWA